MVWEEEWIYNGQCGAVRRGWEARLERERWMNDRQLRGMCLFGLNRVGAGVCGM